MGDAFIVRKSGSKKGGGLLLKVIAASSAAALPESAAENTLAVITGTDITSWAFCSVRQEAYNVEGFVWFYTKEAEEYTSVNILPENEVRLNINACMQYHNGVWTVKPSWIYTGGAWIRNATVLYCKGDKETPLTGGIRLFAATHGKYTDNADSVTLSYSNTTPNRNSSMTIKTAFDLSAYSAICVDADVTAVGSTSYGFYVGVIADLADTTFEAMENPYRTTEKGRKTHRLTVPAGLSAVYVMVAAAVATATVYKIWLE